MQERSTPAGVGQIVAYLYAGSEMFVADTADPVAGHHYDTVEP